MRVLGISDNHNAGAALVVDGELRFALNEERIIRRKNALAFPTNAIAEVLRLGGLRPSEIDLVCVAGEITPSFLLRSLPALHQGAKNQSGQFGLLFTAYTYFQVLARAWHLPYAIDRALSQQLLTRRLRALGLRCAVRMRDHHTAHAQAAFLCGPFQKALVITADAMGDGVTATVSIGHPDGHLEALFEQSGLAALNPYYSRVTEILGFIPNRHEGKVTGLAAYGDPNRLGAHFRRTLTSRNGRFSNLGNPLRHSRHFGWYRHLYDQSKEDVAAACQDVLEDAVTEFVDYWVRRSGLADVCLAGGIFENVKLNQRVRELDSVSRVSIFPNMSDGGLAAGAALGEAGAKPKPLPTVYLGTSYTDEEIKAALDEARAIYTKPKSIADAVAELLVQRKVVPRFVGGMEYGPRALGNRTIYFRPDDPSVNDWLNDRLGRSEFMPFAPAVLDTAADRCFVGMGGARFSARYMNMCFDCTEYMRRVAAGCVHIAGTARPQIVRREDNPDMYAILQAYEKRTGVPVLINTSFNMHEEPIVMTPHDALRAYFAAGFTYLAIGPYLVSGKRQ